jgi:methyltransferase
VVLPLVLFALAFVPMLLEMRLSIRNERALRSAGAVEPPGDAYRAMSVAYPACFAAMILEAWRDPPLSRAALVTGAAVFVLAKGIKYWAIATLGPRWTFRVLVPPRSHRTSAGPYRFMRHPNYLGVLGELAGMALLAGAPVTGSLSLAIFGLLLARRIRVEEVALGGR